MIRNQASGVRGSDACLLTPVSCLLQFLNPIQPEEPDTAGEVAIGAQVEDAALFLDPVGGDDALREDVAAGGEVTHGQ